MRVQCTVRTYPYSSPELSKKLADGWLVLLVTPIGNMLEYILEKHEHDRS